MEVKLTIENKGSLVDLCRQIYQSSESKICLYTTDNVNFTLLDVKDSSFPKRVKLETTVSEWEKDYRCTDTGTLYTAFGEQCIKLFESKTSKIIVLPKKSSLDFD